jgi:hypothetical protein
MKPLRDAIADYLALRRSLGFKLRATAAHLIDFASFLEQKAAPYITTALALTISLAFGLSAWVSFAFSLGIGARPIRAPRSRRPVCSRFEDSEPGLIFTPNRRSKVC